MAELFKLVGTIAIDATDATQKIEAVITAGEDLEKKLIGIGADADSSIGSKSGFAAASVWLGNTITELTRRAAQLGKEFVLSGLKYNAAMEGYEVSFGTLLNGDMEKAKKLMENIKAFALNSPLNVSGVADAALQLLNVGTAYENVIPMLKMLGNLSLGDEGKMGRLATVLSQVMGFGQLYGQEKQQFVNAGVPIYQLLEDYYKIVHGMNPAELNLDEMQKAGKITSEHVLGALQLATMSSEEVLKKYGFSGERTVSFYNAMAAMLPTYTGQTQKAEEQTEIAAGTMVKPYQDKATESVLPAYTKMMEALANKYESDEKNKNAANFLGDFVTGVLDSLTDALNGKYNLTTENEKNLTPFGKFLTGIYSFEDLYNEWRKKDVDPDAENDGSGKRFGNPTEDGAFSTRDDIDLGENSGSGGGGSGRLGLVGTLSNIQATMAALPAQIESAASAGVAEGVGNIAVTGTVTTGNVMLDTGVVVGQLAPRMNLVLGGMNAIGARG